MLKVILLAIVWNLVNGGTAPTCFSTTPYYSCSSVTYSWDEPSSTAVPQYNATIFDSSKVFTFPFSFEFFGAQYTKGTAFTNGWLGLGSVFGGTASNIPPSSTPNTQIAPFWSSLQHNAGLSNFTMETLGSEPDRRMVFTWKNFGFKNRANPVSGFSFQLKLYEDSNIIEVHYSNITFGEDNLNINTFIGFTNEAGYHGATLYNGASTSMNNFTESAFRLTPSSATGDSFLDCPTGDPIYTCKVITPNLEDVSSGTSLFGSSTSTVTINLPFTFTFYGIQYTQLSIALNGWVSFLATTSSTSSFRIGNSAVPNAVVAPFSGQLTKGTNMVYYATVGTGSEKRFIVSWSNFRLTNLRNATNLNFQIKMYQSNNLLEFHYGDMIVPPVTNVTTTITALGFENEQGSTGVNMYTGYVYGGYFNHSAFRYTPKSVTSPSPSVTPTVSVSPVAQALTCPSSTYYSCSFGSASLDDLTNGDQFFPGAIDADDNATYVDLPFPMKYFSTYTSSVVSVSSNGWASLTNYNASSHLTSATIPTVGSPDALLAPFWSDLVINTANFKYGVFGTAPNRRFVIGWNSAFIFAYDGTNITMQIKLYETSYRIEFHYDAATPTTNSYTVGIENYYGNQGLQILRSQPQALAGQKIVFDVIGPSASPSVTPSITPSISVTPSITPTISTSPSITPTISPSCSITPTVTPSITPSMSITPSVTPSTSSTPSITPSPSVTPSNTPSITPSPSVTPSTSSTPSVTPSVSSTPSVTPSSSSTPSTTPSSSSTPSRTPSVTPTRSVTPSRSATPSVTPSVTRTPSVTPSISSSPSVTPSNTRTPSVTPSNTRTPSVTPTVTPSVSPTPSVTPSTSSTPSTTPSTSPTPSVTPSSTPSPILPTKLVVQIYASVAEIDKLNVSLIRNNIASILGLSFEDVEVYLTVLMMKKQVPNVLLEVSLHADNSDDLADQLVSLAQDDPSKIFGTDTNTTTTDANVLWRGPKPKEDKAKKGLSKSEVAVVAVLCTVIPTLIIFAVVVYFVTHKKTQQKIHPVEAMSNFTPMGAIDVPPPQPQQLPTNKLIG